MKDDTTLLSGPRDALLHAVQTVLGIVLRRHTLPILNHLLIRGDAGVVTLTASDLECQIGSACSAAVQPGAQAFTVTVAAHKLADILRALPPGADVRLARSRGRAAQLTLTSGRSRFTLQTLPAEDFPMVRAATPAAQLQLPQATLSTLLDRVAFAMASHDIRYYLNGVLIVVDRHELTAVGTDGNRLAMAQATLASPDDSDDSANDNDNDNASTSTSTSTDRLEFILPRKTVLELQRLLRGAPAGDLHLALSAAQAVFNFGSLTFISKLIEGRYPDYRRVVPQGHPHSLTLDAAVLRASLERAALLTSDKFRGVRLVLQPGLLSIVASNAAQEEALEEMAVDHDGPALDIGLNVGYLIDLLVGGNADDGGTVQVALRDAQSALLFTRPGEPGFCYVVSPMRI